MAPEVHSGKEIQLGWASPRVDAIAMVQGTGLIEVRQLLSRQPIKNPTRLPGWGCLFRSLAMTYSHMGKPHTTIGDEPFHC